MNVNLDAKVNVRGKEDTAKIEGQLFKDPSEYGFKGKISSSLDPEFISEIELMRTIGLKEWNTFVDLKVVLSGKQVLFKGTHSFDYEAEKARYSRIHDDTKR